MISEGYGFAINLLIVLGLAFTLSAVAPDAPIWAYIVIGFGVGLSRTIARQEYHSPRRLK